VRALCLHGHFYQPPREHPWLGVLEPEPSAAPYRDWNTRITAECYAPNAAARILDASGRLADLVDIYEWTSFNFGPTLLAWLTREAPEVTAALRHADAASQKRTGFGNAWAQAYSHPILPLSSARDIRTQVWWGRRDFEHRFGRAPEGMWLPEMAVDRRTLVALAEAGISLTMLAPHQARRIRPLGGGDDAWQAVDPNTLDTHRVYRAVPGPGLAIDVVFRDGPLSLELAFGGLLADGARLGERLRSAIGDASDGTIITVANDGETYGHHHRFGEMALAFALRALRDDRGLTLAGPAAFRAAHPPAFEVELADDTSWSCPHGVERWRAACGCRGNGPADWSQQWRAPLRAAIDWLREQVDGVFEQSAGDVLRDPWGARERYIACLLEPARTSTFLATEAGRTLAPAAAVHARRALEMARNGLFMQTSCGWFFDELNRIEPLLVLRYAARAIELAETLGARLEDEFLARLAPARSNLADGLSGVPLYERNARGQAATPQRVAATATLIRMLGHPEDPPGYEVRLARPVASDRVSTETAVVERSTGAATTVSVVLQEVGAGGPACRVGETVFTLADLFAIQRERLLHALGRDAVAEGRAAMGRLRPLLGPLVDEEDVMLPPELALLLGWDGAEEIGAALEAATVAPSTLAVVVAELKRHGATVPGRWLAPRITRALEERLKRLPGAAGEALALLDLAETVGVSLDLARAQTLLLAWWKVSPNALRARASLRALHERLALSPESA
jgi:alpha-amylase/alpha-mannosidase (GH57 family)